MNYDNYFTPYLDGNKDRICVGDVLIIGEDPKKHTEYEVKFDEDLRDFTASTVWANGAVFTVRLSHLDKIKKSEWFIK